MDTLSRLLPVLLLFLFALSIVDASNEKPVLCSKLGITRPYRSASNSLLPNALSNTTETIAQQQSAVLPSNSSTLASPFKPIGITYHGGSIMYQGINVYVVWYGSWAPTHKSIIRNFLNSFSPTNSVKPGTVGGWWGINTLYYNSRGKRVLRNIRFAKEASDSYSYGKNGLDANDFANVVYNSITARRLPADTNGVYIVLTSKDTKLDGFCSNYCGYHTAFISKSKYYKFGVVGHAGQCVRQCSTSSPNGVPGLDGTMSVIAHELTEAATNPVASAWYDISGYENADKCAWRYGATKRAGNGQLYNVVGANKKKYLLQMNWNPKTGKCVLNL